MDEKCMTNTCSFAGVKPIMVDLPYPPLRVKGKNCDYAQLLKVDYCGAVSEMSAITQYINNENRLFLERCSMAKTLLGIAMAEMMHLQKLGELIFLLGGEVDGTSLPYSTAADYIENGQLKSLCTCLSKAPTMMPDQQSGDTGKRTENAAGRPQSGRRRNRAVQKTYEYDKR